MEKYEGISRICGTLRGINTITVLYTIADSKERGISGMDIRTKLALSRKQFYTSLEKLTSLRSLQRKSNTYTLSTFGEVVISLLDDLYETQRNRDRLVAGDALRGKNKELDKIADQLVPQYIKERLENRRKREKVPFVKIDSLDTDQNRRRDRNKKA